MRTDAYPWQPSALTTFQSLSEAERNHVLHELSRWWSLPHSQWPAERLVPSSNCLDEQLFTVDDRWGIALRWQDDQPVQITGLLRRTVKVVPLASRIPAWRNPEILLAWAVVAFLAFVVFHFIAVLADPVHSKGWGSERSLESLLWEAWSWIAFLIGVLLLLRRFFRLRLFRLG